MISVCLLVALLLVGWMTIVSTSAPIVSTIANIPSLKPTMPTTLPSQNTAFPVIPSYFPTSSPHSISIITTIAGNGSSSDSGDGGVATSATTNSPHAISLDSNENIFFSEWQSNHVRKITVATGIISTYAGSGASSYSGDGGVASSAAINSPEGLSIDKSGINAVKSSFHSCL